MTQKYSLVVEGDDANGYSAYVPELPAILVVADSLEELELRGAEAVRLYLGEIEVGVPV